MNAPVAFDVLTPTTRGRCSSTRLVALSSQRLKSSCSPDAWICALSRVNTRDIMLPPARTAAASVNPTALKTGSMFDLLLSIKPNNLFTMLAAGAKNIPLTKYLIGQVLQSKEQRMEELRKFVPNAKSEDWDLVVAGQRVQVIKDTEAGGKGTLQFGTEVVSAADGSVAALLGASPGASGPWAAGRRDRRRCGRATRPSPSRARCRG